MALVSRHLVDNKQGLGHGTHKKSLFFLRPVYQYFSHPAAAGILTRKLPALVKETPHWQQLSYTVSSVCVVSGIGETSHPYTSQTLGPIWMPFQIYVRPGSRRAKFDQNQFSRCRCAHA